MLKFKILFKIILSLVFAGFVFPLWYAHGTTLDAINEDPLLNSMSSEYLSKELALLGYTWMGCSMIWLFWYVTRKNN